MTEFPTMTTATKFSFTCSDAEHTRVVEWLAANEGIIYLLQSQRKREISWSSLGSLSLASISPATPLPPPPPPEYRVNVELTLYDLGLVSLFKLAFSGA